MVEGSLGWLFIILGIFVICVVLVLLYRMRMDIENKKNKHETLIVQSVSYGILLMVTGIVVVYLWGIIKSQVLWVGYILIIMLLGLIVFYSPPVIKL